MDWVAYQWEPNLPLWKAPLATLKLPAGNYLISAKVSAWLSTWNTYWAWGGLECFAGLLQDVGVGDWMTEGVGSGPGGTNWELATTFPMKLTAKTNTIQFACRIWGGIISPDDGSQQPVGAKVWGVRLVAERVGPVIEQ